ncbi:hypothetical protein [Streptomyces goshikiensis]|uniref:hypothetical protein n=1 Tax=Streptomyces goshikiensis TaxID=1942 RepID=UPI0036AA981C
MSLHEDLVFYRGLISAQALTAEEAVAAVQTAHGSHLAAAEIRWWMTAADEEVAHREQHLFDLYDAYRALQNGHPIPAAVDARIAQRSVKLARAGSLRMIRRWRRHRR